MKLVNGMVLASMLAVAGGAGAVEQAVDATQSGDGASSGPAPSAGSGMSSEDEWACKVAMCLANPGGPTEFAECVDPIKHLQRHLAKGKPFPVCPFTGVGGQQGARGDGERSGDRDPLQAL